MQVVLFVDSRARTGGSSDSPFSTGLRESLHLSDHEVRVDKMRSTNSLLTTELGKYFYYKDGSGLLQYYAVPEQAYTGALLDAIIQIASGRTTTYSDVTNTNSQTVTTGQE